MALRIDFSLPLSLGLNVLAVMVSGQVYAASCDANATDPGTCSDLVINTDLTSISIAAGTTVDASSSPYALEIINPGTAVTVGTVTVSGTVYSTSNTGIVVRHGNTVDLILITDTGTVHGGWSGIYNEWGGASIGTITNLGTVTADNDYAIYNDGGTIGTVNNLQGSGNSNGALQYRGNLPSNYNVIIYGKTYGQVYFDGYNNAEVITFGIYSGDKTNGVAASSVESGTYSQVISGLSAANIANVTGTYNGVAWQLVNEAGSSTIWDLVVLNYGSDQAEPLRALIGQRQLQIRNSTDYDCIQFDNFGGCTSFRGRYSSFGDRNESAGVLTVAKRISPTLRVGAFMDQHIAGNAADGLSVLPSLPMIGLFADYSPRGDGTGFHARLSTNYGYDYLSITRKNLSGTANTVTGKTSLVAYGIAQKLGYGIDLGRDLIVTPYGSFRYTIADRLGYKETYKSGVVDDPFTYQDLSATRKTGAIGIEIDGKYSDRVRYNLGAGLDYDLANDMATFKASSSDLGSMSYSGSSITHRARLFGSAGLAIEQSPGKALTLDTNASQLDYGNDLALSVMAGFRVSF